MKKALPFVFILFTAFTALPAQASNRLTPVAAAVRDIQDSVVNIRTEKIVKQRPLMDPFFDDFFGFSNTYRTQSLGSGVIISSDGIIITNNHVVEAANKIFVILTDNRQTEAEIIGTDPTLDIAVIKIKNKIDGLKPARLGKSSDIMLGETVIAMGNPYGLNSSVTTGVVSNVRRIVGGNAGFSVFVQTDALINPGNSGGPLINLDGEVIGINTAVYREAQGIGFSIPIDTVKRAVPEFVLYGAIRRGFPGFSVKEKGGGEGGLEIASVYAKSAASGAVVKEGYRLISLDGIPVNTINAFRYIVRTFPRGCTVSAVFAGEGRRIETDVEMIPLPKDYGLSLLKSKYGITFTETGSYIIVSSSGAEKYIRRGDILLAVNNMELSSSAHLSELLNDAEGTSAVFTFTRNNGFFNVQLSL